MLIKRVDAATALRQKRAARSSLLAHAAHFDHTFKTPPHVRETAEAIDALLRGDIGRLMIIMPPQHGKSTLASINTPAFALGLNPDERIIMASYDGGLSRMFSGMSKAIVDSPRYKALHGLELNPRYTADAFWRINNATGRVLATSVKGKSSGFPASLYILDDLIKGPAEADSLRIRESIWQWYIKVVLARLEPGGAVLFATTRWHLDDPAGRILNTPGRHDFELVHFKALDENDNALWPDYRSAEELLARRRDVGDRAFEAVWQGNPLPGSSLVFAGNTFILIDSVYDVDANPEVVKVVRYWDKAATVAQTASYSSGLLLMVLRVSGGDSTRLVYIIADLRYGQWATPDRESRITETMIADNRLYPGLTTAVEREPGSGGVDSAWATITANSRYGIIIDDSPDSNKIARADGVAVRAAQGDVYMLRGPWNQFMLSALTQFPFGINDPVDALSGAYKISRSATAIFVGAGKAATRKVRGNVN